MEIEQTTGPAGTVLRLTGRLDTDSVPKAEPQLLGALPAGGALVLDLSKLKYCSSAGLRLLLKTMHQAEAKRARLGLAHVQPAVQEVLETSGFDRLLRLFPTTEAAVAGLR